MNIWLGSLYSENYDGIMEDFYLDFDFHYATLKKGSPLTVIVSNLQEKEIKITTTLLEQLYKLPNDILTLEDLETFGHDLIDHYWKLFTIDPLDDNPHLSYAISIFALSYFYPPEFCCRVLENRAEASEICTGLRFRMMMAIMSCHKVKLVSDLVPASL